MQPVAGQVLDIGADRLAALDRVPKQAEHGPGHVGMADDLVRRAFQLLPVIMRHTPEHVVARADDAALIRA